MGPMCLQESVLSAVSPGTGRGALSSPWGQRNVLRWRDAPAPFHPRGPRVGWRLGRGDWAGVQGCTLQPLAQTCGSDTDTLNVRGGGSPQAGKAHAGGTETTTMGSRAQGRAGRRRGRENGGGRHPRPQGSSGLPAGAAGRACRRPTHLQQQPVDLLRELLGAGLQGLLLHVWLSREHVLIQRPPAWFSFVSVSRGPASSLQTPGPPPACAPPSSPQLTALPERGPAPPGGRGQVSTGTWWEVTWVLVSQPPGEVEHSHPDSVSPDDEGDLPAPRVDEAGPAGVQRDVLPVPGTEPDGGIVERLPTGLHD